MSIAFKNDFGANYRAQVVSWPTRPSRCFSYPGAIEGGRVDGVGIEFTPDGGEVWFASFSSGDISPNAISFAGSTPSRTKALVISKGEGYVVDAINPQEWFELPLRPVMGVLCLPHDQVIVVWDFVRMVCVDNGIRWRTPSVSWDGIKEVAHDGQQIVAKIWDAPTSSFGTVRIAIADGALNGGSSPELIDIVR
jgi:hypothetical protein